MKNMKKEETVIENLICLLPYWHYKIERPIKQNQKHAQISYEAYYCLLSLQIKGALKMSELALSLKMSKQHATQIIDKLYQHNLIERSFDEQDRRIIRIAISAFGLEFLSQHQFDGSSLLLQLQENLNQEEVDQLKEATATLLELLPKLH